MSTTTTENLQTGKSASKPAATRRPGPLKRTAQGTVIAGAIAALSLTAISSAAHAHGPGVGAAVGLGVLGGVLAGAAITSTTPVYTAPAPYYYPPNNYYGTAPAYYAAPQPYYATPYGYSPYYGYYYSR